MNKKRYAILDVGGNGVLVYHYLVQSGGADVLYWINNSDCLEENRTKLGIPVISIQKWKDSRNDTILLLTGGRSRIKEKIVELISMGIFQYEVFDVPNVLMLSKVERLVSYSYPNICDDIILYPVLKDVYNLFYIDVGCNDPIRESVTKFFYDRGGCGINIDPLHEYIKLYDRERPRDINLCLAIGEEQGELDIFVSGFYGTRSSKYESNTKDGSMKRVVPVSTLTEICMKYVPKNQDIHFLKIDVEGMEEAVVNGMDWGKYRPWILCIEAFTPSSGLPSYISWENKLIKENYIFAFEHGVNRYYVANEKCELKTKFISCQELMKRYYVTQAVVSEF